MNRKETRTQRKCAEGRHEKREETRKPGKRATAQVLPYYSTSTASPRSREQRVALPYLPASPKSRTPANQRFGGLVLAAGTGSPRKILAFVFWIVQAITAYQRLISSAGSSSKATARAKASFFVTLMVCLAQRPCLSKDNAAKSNGTWR